MRNLGSAMRNALGLLGTIVAGLSVACGSSEPRTDAERLARGREIVERMSTKLAAAPAMSVTTLEERDEIKKTGGTQKATLTRETTVRRPDRLYSKISGDRQNEIWYDGVGLTIVMHNDKIYGQARAPETLDKTLDAIYERYGVAPPLADYIYSSPAKALLTDTTTGGWVGRETVAGQPTDHLSFKDTGVNWEVWIASTGDPLPQKMAADFTDNKRLRKIVMTFKDWSLAPQIPDDRFAPKVPPDYEGVAVVQRARVLKNLPQGDDSATPAPQDKKK
jgi:hypothetical protein